MTCNFGWQHFVRYTVGSFYKSAESARWMDAIIPHLDRAGLFRQANSHSEKKVNWHRVNSWIGHGAVSQFLGRSVSVCVGAIVAGTASASVLLIKRENVDNRPFSSSLERHIVHLGGGGIFGIFSNVKSTFFQRLKYILSNFDLLFRPDSLGQLDSIGWHTGRQWKLFLKYFSGLYL